jgi:hypothetical protein
MELAAEPGSPPSPALHPPPSAAALHTPPPFHAAILHQQLQQRRSGPTTGALASPQPLRTGCEDHWSWNKHDKSHEVRLYGPKQRIAHFHPNWSNGTAGVRGTRVLNGGRYYWEINVSQRKTKSSL